MVETNGKSSDPRVRRTRLLLQGALASLLQERKFEEISVQDITDEATVNRATFYAHYPDKYALLVCTTAAQFLGFLEKRGVKFDGTCSSALHHLFVGIGDYLISQSGDCSNDPYMESAMVAVLRKVILDGLQKHPWDGSISREMAATTVSWALYGAAKEWLATENRTPSIKVAEKVVELLSSLLHPPAVLEPAR